MGGKGEGQDWTGLANDKTDDTQQPAWTHTSRPHGHATISEVAGLTIHTTIDPWANTEQMVMTNQIDPLITDFEVFN